MSDRTVVIGGAAGMWGDSVISTGQLLGTGRLDYLMYEGLAEITMGILTRAKLANPERGYATDIIRTIGSILGECKEQGVKVVTNAGGINPGAAADSIRAAAAEAGLDVKVAAVSGDDLMGRLDELRELNLTDMFTGAPLPEYPISFNAYLGAMPIAAALEAGADVVVTGRVVDSALVLGPLVHEFGWGADDWDLLSAGSLAGHLLECGPQSTGGLFTDWEAMDSWENIGYPMAECRADGSFILTKPDGTDGLVTPATAAEQLLYEIGDPAAYLLPDVACDWTRVRMEQVGDDQVEVTGALGRPAPATLKACAQTLDGFKLVAGLFIGGRQAAAKARRLADNVIARSSRLLAEQGFAPFDDVDVEVIGAEATYGPHTRAGDAREVIVKVGVAHQDEKALRVLMKEVPSFGLAVQGVSGGGTGLPKATPRVRLGCYLVPRELLPATIDLDGNPVAPAETPHMRSSDRGDGGPEPVSLAETPHMASSGTVRVDADADSEAWVGGATVALPLVAIAHGRSGDKGGDANLGVRARHPDFLAAIRAQVTAEAVKDYLAHAVEGHVDRYDLPGIDAVNFHLHDALGGGGIASLRYDPQGKAFAQQLMDMEVAVPVAWLDHPSINEVPEVATARTSLA